MCEVEEGAEFNFFSGHTDRQLEGDWRDVNTGRLELSHWSTDIQIRCSDWWKAYCAATKVYDAIKTSKMLPTLGILFLRHRDRHKMPQ